MARARRGRGEGCIHQRADGTWQGGVSLGHDGNGHRKRKWVYGATKKEVADKLDEIRNAARIGTLPDAGAMTVGQLLEHWLQAQKPKIGTRTYEAKESLVRVHLQPRIGGVRLARVNAVHVQQLVIELHNDGVKPWAARHAIDVLDYALSYAVGLNRITSNPCQSIEKPRPNGRRPAFLTEDQARLVRELSAGLPVHPLLVTALGTGCRQGELLALGWGDLDLTAGVLTVRRSLSMTKAGFVVKEPRTGRERTVALPRFAVDALVTLKAARLKAGLLSAPVFCTRTGNHLNKNNVLRAFRAVVAKVNDQLAEDPGAKSIPAAIRFHDLRHTVASILLSSGHSLRAVSQRLGHADPSLTLKVYAHCLPGDDGKLAEGLAKMLG